ncbi:MAG: hypothetical protein AAGI45_11015 [Cyanobacteria bacterium P01_H01_bin.26]
MVSCTSEECIAARRRVQSIRNELIRICEILKVLFQSRDSTSVLVGVFGGIAAATAAAAAAAATIPVIGQLAALVILIFAGIFFILSAFFTARLEAINNQIQQVESEFDATVKNFQDAVSSVIENCPDECWGDLSLPSCDF